MAFQQRYVIPCLHFPFRLFVSIHAVYTASQHKGSNTKSMCRQDLGSSRLSWHGLLLFQSEAHLVYMCGEVAPLWLSAFFAYRTVGSCSPLKWYLKVAIELAQVKSLNPSSG